MLELGMPVVLQPTRLSINYRPQRSTRLELSAAIPGLHSKSLLQQNSDRVAPSVSRSQTPPAHEEFPPLLPTVRTRVHHNLDTFADYLDSLNRPPFTHILHHWTFNSSPKHTYVHFPRRPLHRYYVKRIPHQYPPQAQH